MTKPTLTTASPSAAPVSTPPPNIINPTSIEYDQSAPPSPYLKMRAAYDLDEGNFGQWAVRPGPGGVQYFLVQTFTGPVYYYSEINFLPGVMGTVITKQ